MLRSLFAGISGMRVNQTMLDVTGNNISNANTVGFKSSSTVFSDTLSQMLTAASAPAAGPNPPAKGGTNPVQIGLGVQLAAVTGNFTQGSNETTGVATDAMINGDGFFTIENGQGDISYTRAGNFHWDSSGDLVTNDGQFVMGYDTTTNSLTRITQPAGLGSVAIGQDGTVSGTDSSGNIVTVGQLAITNFVNPQGLTRVGDTDFQKSLNSGAPEVGVSGQNGTGTITSGALEMSNVDLSQEFTNLILAQRGFEASSKVITTSDQVLGDLVNMIQG